MAIKLNQSVVGPDLGKLLQHESGVFEAQIGGQKFRVECEPGASVASFLQTYPKASKGTQSSIEPWTITKIGEIRTESPGG